MMKKIKTIGALILTKNNSNTIQPAINSVAHFCKQVVVLDTGSTDTTPVIAQRSGAEVHFFEWINDFSAARNEALRYIYTDWVLVLDSDEILADFDENQFQRLTDNANIGGINFIIDNNIDHNGNQTISSHRYTRLFLNKNEIRFTGRIHEQIRGSIELAGYDIYDSEFKILHLGYNNIDENKIRRNQELIELDINDTPNDDWLKFHLAGTHFASGNHNEAFKLFYEIIYSDQLSISQSELAKIRLAQIYLKKDDFDNVHKYTDFISSDYQNEALRCYVKGTAYLLQKNIDKALKLLQKALEINSPAINSDEINHIIKIANTMQ